MQAVVFDLDGTLIDSAPSILASLRSAFLSLGIAPALKLTPDLIGPPLDQMLRRISGTDDARMIASLSAAYKQDYDTDGYSKAVAFDGVDAMLSALVEKGMPLYIATNKRIEPSIRILCHLGWDRHFVSISALDCFDPPKPDKTALLKVLFPTCAT